MPSFEVDVITYDPDKPWLLRDRERRTVEAPSMNDAVDLVGAEVAPDRRAVPAALEEPPF